MPCPSPARVPAHSPSRRRRPRPVPNAPRVAARGYRLQVHCKAGKGRTGLMVSCLLMHLGHEKCAKDAIDFYNRRRTHDGRGLTVPSQRRCAATPPHGLPGGRGAVENAGTRGTGGREVLGGQLEVRAERCPRPAAMAPSRMPNSSQGHQPPTSATTAGRCPAAPLGCWLLAVTRVA